MSERIHDFAGIGIGPFNLGLACLTEPIAELDGIFLDQKPRFDWHPGLLLESATLQTPFLSDLVTLADPTSRFSFLNYLKQQGRIYAFYIRENFFLLRNEYNQYCQWAAEQLPNLEFNTRVERIEYRADKACYEIAAVCTRSGQSKHYRARRLVLGTGTVPWVPECCRSLPDRAIHAADYLRHKRALQAGASISVIGSGQSAAEIYHDLLQDIDTYGYRLDWITRSPRFFPLEYSKLTLEMTSPEYVDYFYGLPQATRERLAQEHKNLYKGIDGDLINAIYDLLYTKHLIHDVQVNLWTHSTLENIEFDTQDRQFELALYHTEQQRRYRHRTQGLILATGYSWQRPAFLDGIADRIRWDDRGRFDVSRQYSIDHRDEEIFVQNAELHTHGFVTPDLGMASYRNSCLIRAMTGREIYPIEKRIAFQQFEAPADSGELATSEPLKRLAGAL